MTELVGTLAHEDKSKVSTQLLNESLTRTTAEQKGLECASQKSIHADNPDRPPAGPEQAHRLADGSVVSMASRQSGNRDPAESQTRPTASNFLVTASYLLDVHALKVGEMHFCHLGIILFHELKYALFTVTDRVDNVTSPHTYILGIRK